MEAHLKESYILLNGLCKYMTVSEKDMLGEKNINIQKYIMVQNICFSKLVCIMFVIKCILTTVISAIQGCGGVCNMKISKLQEYVYKIVLIIYSCLSIYYGC